MLIDEDFGLAQIFPLSDEDSEHVPQIVSAAFADPFILLVRSDGTLVTLKADHSGDLDELEQGASLKGAKWSSGSLYEDLNDVFRLEYGDEEDEASNVLMFLLSASGGLHVS